MGSPRLRDFDLNLLVVLDAVIAERSVRRAAKRLGVSQPAVSHALGRLRTLFGDPLVVRTPKGMAPTPRAERLKGALRDHLRGLEGLVDDEGSFEPARARRTFTLYAVDAVELVLLPGWAKHVAEVAPGLHLRFLPSVPSVFSELEAGSLDLAIGVLPTPPVKAFRHQVLYRQRFLCVVRRGHPIDLSSLTLERYLALSHVGVAPFGQPGNVIDEALAKLGHRREVAVVVPHFLVAPLVVAETDYVAVLPEGTARQFAGMLSLRLFEPPFAIEPLVISLLWHERAQFDPAHTWLRETAIAVTRSLR